MIRIGFIRWHTKVEKIHRNNGQIEIALTLTPQAKRYKSMMGEWTGLKKNFVERERDVEPQRVAQVEQTWGMSDIKTAGIINGLAKELSAQAVNYSVRIGILDAEGYNIGAGKYLVKTALMNCMASGVNEEIAQVPFIDLAPEMRAVREERQRQEEERKIEAAARWNQHQAENAERNAERRRLDDIKRKAREGATEISFDLLYSMLNSVEREEAKGSKKVTVKNLAGTFVVPVMAHGLVDWYVNGEYKKSLCVVFQDYSIPLGDEVLMKVALLKTDPQHFLTTAVQFHRPFDQRLKAS